MRLTVSPNPSGGNVVATLSEKDDKTKKKNINEIKIIDKMGNIKQQYKFGKGVKDASFNVSTLPADIYTIMAFDGTIWIPAKLIKN